MLLYNLIFKFQDIFIDTKCFRGALFQPLICNRRINNYQAFLVVRNCISIQDIAYFISITVHILHQDKQ